MPINGKRKRNLTFKNAKRSKVSTAAVAKKAVQMFPGLVRTSRNYLRSSNNPNLLPEKKYYDSSYNNLTNVQYLPLGNILSVRQGTTSSERIGNKITLNNINMKITLIKPTEYNLLATPTANPPTILCRIILFRDKQMNGTFPQVTDLLTNTANQIPGVNAFRNMDTIDRFDFVYDKVHTITSSTLTPDTQLRYAEAKKFVKIAKVCKDVINYSGTTGVDTELRSIGYGLIVLLDHGLLQIQNQLRIKFYDA